jgi:hypothetical protein
VAPPQAGRAILTSPKRCRVDAAAGRECDRAGGFVRVIGNVANQQRDALRKQQRGV